MPVIHVQALPQADSVEVPAVLTRLVQAVAPIMGVPPERVWATWTPLEAGHYVEGTKAGVNQPHASHPPIVRLSAYAGRSPETIRQALTTMADVLCQDLHLESGNVFAHYEEIPAGRIYVSGQVK